MYTYTIIIKIKKQNMTSGHPGAPFSGHSLLPPRLLSSDSEPVVLPLSFPQHAAQPHLAPTLYVGCCACWLCPGVSAMCPCLVSGLAPEEPQHLLTLLGCPGRMLLAWLLWHSSIAGRESRSMQRGKVGSGQPTSFYADDAKGPKRGWRGDGIQPSLLRPDHTRTHVSGATKSL